MAHLSLERLAEIRRHHPLHNTYAEIKASMGQLEKLAVWITEHVGTMAFFLLILGWSVAEAASVRGPDVSVASGLSDAPAAQCRTGSTSDKSPCRW